MKNPSPFQKRRFPRGTTASCAVRGKMKKAEMSEWTVRSRRPSSRGEINFAGEISLAFISAEGR